MVVEVNDEEAELCHGQNDGGLRPNHLHNRLTEHCDSGPRNASSDHFSLLPLSHLLAFYSAVLHALLSNIPYPC